MKFLPWLAMLALSLSFHTAYANEMETTENQDFTYCKEQVESYGIVDEQEKKQFVQECLDSFKAPVNDAQAPQE